MKFELNGFNAYVISEHNGGYVINDCNGFLMTPEQMIEISRGLMLCAMQDEGEINAYNEKRKIEFEEQLHARYEYLRLTGEWFALGTKEINEIKSYLNEV